jgi:hypothetical protein
MQAHRSDLSAARRLRPTPPPGQGTVYGLGLTDALRVELQPCQLSELIDELDALREPLGEAFERARAEWGALTSRADGDPLGVAAAAEQRLEGAAYALRILTAIRSQVPAPGIDRPFAIVGPATTISTIITGAAQNAADRLGDSLRKRSKRDSGTRDRLRELAVAALAWVETYIDCEAIEWYRFDPDWDPVTVVG